MLRFPLMILVFGLTLAGCSSETLRPAEPVAKKPTEAAAPEEYKDAATALLGSEAQVLLYGDLAKNGTKQVLIADVVPNTPKSTVAGTVVTRAVVAQNDGGNW